MENNKKFICSVGYYTNKGVTRGDEENVELSSYGGNSLYCQYPICDLCKKTMKVMIYLHCPVDDNETRHVSVFYCPNHPCFKAIPSIFLKKTQEITKSEAPMGMGGFDLVDIDDSTFASIVSSQPTKETKKKKKENCCGKWIEWYDEFKFVREFDESELKKIDEYHTEGEEEFEDEFERVPDSNWDKFLHSMNENPKQIVRYGGEPLLINDSNQGKEECNEKCPNCGNELLYEFEILPSIISLIKDIPEFGALLIYSCERCCNANESYVVVFEPNE